MPELHWSDWLEGGFPKPRSVTKNQRSFINRRAHQLKKVLSTEQMVALKLMRFEFWLDGLSRLDASAIINKMYIIEDAEKNKKRAEKVLKKHSGKIREDICTVCGGELDNDLISPTCLDCGKGSFRVQL